VEQLPVYAAIAPHSILKKSPIALSQVAVWTGLRDDEYALGSGTLRETKNNNNQV
jgi:hypothetical protein